MNRIPFTEKDYNIHYDGTEEIFKAEAPVCTHRWSDESEPKNCTWTPECCICGFTLHTTYY